MKTIHTCRGFSQHWLGLISLGLVSIWQTAPAEEALRILNENCMRCHGAEKRKGGFAMHTRAAMMKGGETGDAVDLDKPSASLLVELLQPDADPHMPPKKQLSDAEIDSVINWIKAGANWDDKTLSQLPAPRDLKWQSLPNAYAPIGALRVSPDGKQIAIGRGERLQLLDLSDKELATKTEMKASRDVLQSIAWHPDGKRVVSGGFRRAVVWDASNGEKLKVIRTGLIGRINALQFVREGKELVIAESLPTQVGRLVIVDTATWKIRKTIRAHVDSIYHLAVSPDGKLLATSSADKIAHLWKIADWKSAGTLEGHLGYVLGASFNPGGDRIATVSADSTVKVWDVKTRKQISTFSDRSSKLAVTGVHWTLNPAEAKPKSDADWIITVSEDSKPRLYTNLTLHDGAQRSTGAKMRAWSAAAAGSTRLAFSPATKQVFAGDVDGGVTIWDINGKLLKRLE